MDELLFEDFSLLQLAALAEEFVWGELELDDEEREGLRRKLIERFAQVEELKRAAWAPLRPIRHDK
jgi:hypothetical protein